MKKKKKSQKMQQNNLHLTLTLQEANKSIRKEMAKPTVQIISKKYKKPKHKESYLQDREDSFIFVTYSSAL